MATRISSVPAATSCPGRLWNIQSVVAAIAQFAKTPGNLCKASTRVRGRGLRIQRFPWGYATSLFIKMKSCVPLNVFSCLACESLSLFTAFAYCPVADCGWPENLIVLTGF